MKKLYTLLLAAAVTITAAATVPFQGNRIASPVKEHVKFTTSKATAQNYNPETLAKAAITANSRADEYPSIDSKYMLISYPDNEETSTPDAYPCHLYEDEAEPAGSGYYYLEDFIMSGTNKIECYMDYKTVSSQGQEFTVLRLVIPANTTLYSTKNGTYKLYLFAYTEQGPSIIVDENDDYVDIEFWYSQGAWILPQGEDWGVAWINSSTNRGSWIIEPILVPTNGTYESVEIIDMDDKGNITDYNEVSTEIYAEFNEENNSILLANFGNCHKLITLSIDATKQEVVANNQSIIDIPYETEEGYIYFDGILTNFGSQDGNFTASLKTENGKTVITNDLSWILIQPNEILGNTKPVWYSIFQDNKITLDFEIPGLSGISNVTVADENAPVEYYNLQGVRVENPANGLYIKRQGKTATKVFVK